MSRREFTRATRRDALTRSGGKCEAIGLRYGLDAGLRCDAPLSYGVEFDHELPCEFGGDNSLDNARAVCRKCHRYATANDIRAIRKSDRVRDKHHGTIKPSSHGFNRSRFRKRMDGTVVDRETGAIIRPAYVRPTSGPDRDQMEVEGT